jgi:BRCA1-associated ATM activator 1
MKFSEYNELVKDPDSCVIQWVEQIVESFDSDTLPTQQICNFTLKILSQVCSNEWQFAAIKEKNLLEKIQKGIENHPQLQKPAVKLSHIQLLHSISQHSIGLQWLKHTRSWKLCIDYYQTSNTIFIIREAGNFLFDILSKFTELMKDEQLCVEIIEAIMAFLIGFRGKEGTNDLIVDDEGLASVLIPVSLPYFELIR